MAEIMEKDELRKIVHEIIYEDFIGDRTQFLNILDRLARLEEGQERILQMMDRRFEDVNRRFEDVNRRFEDINKRFSTHTTFMATGFSGLAVLIALLKIFA
jgi:hypothetical protein